MGRETAVSVIDDILKIAGKAVENVLARLPKGFPEAYSQFNRERLSLAP